MRKEPPRPLAVDNFPAEDHRRLKIIAAHRGITIRAAVIEAMQAWIESQLEGGVVHDIDGKQPTGSRKP